MTNPTLHRTTHVAETGRTQDAQPERRQFQLQHCHLDPSRGAVYVSIPKNACTTLKAWFFANLGVDVTSFDRGELHDFGRRRHNLAVLDPAESERWLESAFVFAFVRDPLERLVSGYLNKFVTDRERVNHSSKHVLEAIHRKRGRPLRYDREFRMSWGGHVLPLDSSVDYERGLTFREFVDYLCEERDDFALNEHWRPQWRFLEGIRIDFLGRVETLEADLAEVCGRLGVSPPSKAPRNRTPYTAGEASSDLPDLLPVELRQRPALPPPDAFLTPDLRQKLIRRFAEDVRRYGRAPEAAHP